jgi:hypothetical protein
MGWRQENLALGGTGYVSVSSRAGCGQHFCNNYLNVARSIRKSKPQVIVISGGQTDLDDWTDNPATVKRAVDATFSELRRSHPEATIVAVGPSNVDRGGPAVTEMDAAVKEAAEGVDAEYVSLLKPRVITTSMVLPEGGNVDDTGHKAIAARVLQILEG